MKSLPVLTLVDHLALLQVILYLKLYRDLRKHKRDFHRDRPCCPDCGLQLAGKYSNIDTKGIQLRIFLLLISHQRIFKNNFRGSTTKKHLFLCLLSLIVFSSSIKID